MIGKNIVQPAKGINCEMDTENNGKTTKFPRNLSQIGIESCSHNVNWTHKRRPHWTVPTVG